MQIVNKHSKGITSRNTGSKGAFVSFHRVSDAGQINFSKFCCEKYDLNVGDEINFVIDVDRLYFFKSDDNSGFRLVHLEGGGTRLFCSSLVRMMFEKYPRLKAHFKGLPLRKSVTTINGKELIEILIDKKLISSNKQ